MKINISGIRSIDKIKNDPKNKPTVDYNSSIIRRRSQSGGLNYENIVIAADKDVD